MTEQTIRQGEQGQWWEKAEDGEWYPVADSAVSEKRREDWYRQPVVVPSVPTERLKTLAMGSWFGAFGLWVLALILTLAPDDLTVIAIGSILVYPATALAITGGVAQVASIAMAKR